MFTSDQEKILHYMAVVRLYLMIVQSVFLRPILRTVYGALLFELGDRRVFDHIQRLVNLSKITMKDFVGRKQSD